MKFIEGRLDNYGNSMEKVYFVLHNSIDRYCNALSAFPPLETEKSIGNGQLIISRSDLVTKTSIV